MNGTRRMPVGGQSSRSRQLTEPRCPFAVYSTVERRRNLRGQHHATCSIDESSPWWSGQSCPAAPWRRPRRRSSRWKRSRWWCRRRRRTGAGGSVGVPLGPSTPGTAATGPLNPLDHGRHSGRRTLTASSRRTSGCAARRPPPRPRRSIPSQAGSTTTDTVEGRRTTTGRSTISGTGGTGRVARLPMSPTASMAGRLHLRRRSALMARTRSEAPSGQAASGTGKRRFFCPVNVRPGDTIGARDFRRRRGFSVATLRALLRDGG